MKRLMKTYWLGGKFNFDLKLSQNDKLLLDERLLKCNDTRPREIQREVRDLRHLSYWKASEFRVTLLYTGFVIFKGILPVEVYEHFKFLAIAVRILTCRHHIKNILVAEVMLKFFLESCIDIYGNDSITSNFYALCHVVDDLRHYDATFHDISTFPFENQLGVLKHLVRNGRETLSQITRRISELNALNEAKVDLKISLVHIISDKSIANRLGALSRFNYDSIQNKYSEIRIKDQYILQNNYKNGWILIKNDKIGLFNFAFNLNNKNFICVSILKEIRNFFTSPCSSSLLSIYSTVAKIENNVYFPTFEECINISVTDIKCKFYVLTENNQLIFMPLLHTFD